MTTRRGHCVISGGDIITAIDGSPVSTRDDILLILQERYQPGDTVTVTIVRDGQSQDVKVTLGGEQRAGGPPRA